MRYSKPWEIIVMIVAWAGVLIIYDTIANKHFYQQQLAQATVSSTPQLSMWLQHIGCTPKVAELDKTLRDIAWLDQITIKQKDETMGAEAGGAVKPPEAQNCDLGVLAKVRNLEAVDFMELAQALRAHQIIPTTMEFGGIPHFALKAKLANLCDTCMRAAMDALAPRKDPKGGVTFKWLDSRRVNPKDQSLTAFVRFNNEVHIDEMIRALERAGLPPQSIRIVIE